MAATMIIRMLNLTLSVLVALTVCSYAVVFMYAVVRAALLFYHLLPS